MALKKFNFNVIERDKFSRAGVIKTHRGNIQTPAFMPVGTQATVKACLINDVIKTASEPFKKFTNTWSMSQNIVGKSCSIIFVESYILYKFFTLPLSIIFTLYHTYSTCQVLKS